MAKERIFKFMKEDNTIEEVNSTSFKKAVKSFQNKVKQKLVYIEWLSKKGIEMTKWQKLPLGREKKLGK
jgi:hypothetical protein|tara:strand:+ start:4799 stop:5005 length:207 start_codon:yes stop_codon:yes gene_type:complete